MSRRWMLVVAIVTVVGCGSSSSEPRSAEQGKPAAVPSADDFAGAWRSTVPSLEFIRLSIVSKSSQFGVFGSRLTFSGVAWEGDGRLEGDSLVATLAVAGGGSMTARMIVRTAPGQTLTLRMDAPGSDALRLAFERDR